MSTDNPQSVPYDRFKTVNDQLKAATAELEQLRASAGQAEALAQRVASLEADLARTSAEAAQTVSLARIGVTDADDADYLRYRYDRIPEGERPTFDAWVAAGAEARDGIWARVLPSTPAAPAPSTPAAAPEATAAPAPSTPTAAPEATAAAAPPPSDRAGDAPVNGAQPATWGNQTIAQKAGDVNWYRQHREQILNSTRYGNG
jgi:cell division septation protein DedD